MMFALEMYFLYRLTSFNLLDNTRQIEKESETHEQRI